MRRVDPALVVVAVGLVLLMAAPPPSTAWRELRATSSALDPTGPLVAAAALLAWALATWLAVSVLVTAAGQLPGVAGRLAGAGARRIAPAAIRRAVEVTLGLTVAVGVLGAAPASAASSPTAAATNVAGASATEPSAARPDLDWPHTAAGAAPAEPVLVQPGDSLWRLAAQQLQAAGAPAPSDAQVAQAWPSWWSANRDLVGDDPDLIRPGMRLSPPATPDSPS
ncbi:MAG: LysM peptidoglycan-binding domain-containing protein [Actinobacteria bacterium]|nr:LysM peptidoglycan-binding domain-containing protein [Actinomycetota bacterium]MBW3646516.1 LysM peptidoglycan-binding domain-containing protein [Actinomycetota bacterium]